MAANTAPVYSAVAAIQWCTAVTAANTAMDGTGTVTTVFTSSGTNAAGSYLRRMFIRATGTNVATVLRVFINNGSTNTTAANNVLHSELSLPATTASNTVALPSFDIPLEFALPNSYKINITLGTAVAAGYVAGIIAGDY
jgi:hypothetical protein